MAKDRSDAPRSSTINQELLQALRQPPMSEATWREHLRQHSLWLDFARPHGWGIKFQLLSVSGLPLAVWSGPTATEGKQLNLNHADLTGLSIEWAVIPYSAMPGVLAKGVSFRGASLKRSLLTDGNFDGADFTMAQLEDADFSRSSLRGTCFRKAQLHDADFEGCDLTDADFRGARLRGTKFPGAILQGALGLPADSAQKKD